MVIRKSYKNIVVRELEPGIYHKCPKEVFAAIAVSALISDWDSWEIASPAVLNAWWQLFSCGVVSQKPPFPQPKEGWDEFKDDKYHGQFTLTGADGDKYVGEYKDGKRNGQGTYTDADGSKYVGGWKDNAYHGKGTYTYARGAKYVGEWKDDKVHGQGTYTYPNGDICVGEYRDGKWHEQGTEKLNND